MQPTCIYCGKSSDLNTQLTVTIADGQKVTVDVCDEHAEDATVKSAREKYVERQRKIEEFLEQARALGISVNENASGLIVASSPQPPAQPPAQQPVSRPAVSQKSPAIPAESFGPGWVSTAVVDTAKGMQSKGVSTPHGSVSGHASHSLHGEDVLPEELRRGRVKMDVAQGRGGQPIAIPSKRIDGTGVTRIRILHTENDNTLQARFKNLAEDSKSGGAPDLIYGGYNETTRTCPICRGACIVNDDDCPKCNGTGLIPIY